MNYSWMIYTPEPKPGPMQCRDTLLDLDQKILKIEAILNSDTPSPHPFIRGTLTIALAELNRKRRILAIDTHEMHRDVFV